MMDQHAAHEKVKYERLVAQLREKNVATQNLMPAIVITLSPSELSTLKDYMDNFKAIGYEIDEFGGYDISLRAIPMDLYGKDPKELFLDILDELNDGRISGIPEVINDKLASMACKSAVKGNSPMSGPEIKALLKELLTLDNPYNCPHGRPTIITMTKYEIEKRFKRIV
jgi:DNA mismatch repair protein MutL